VKFPAYAPNGKRWCLAVPAFVKRTYGPNGLESERVFLQDEAGQQHEVDAAAYHDMKAAEAKRFAW